jgi:predicted negative regulator of RcsB-dependent stress response
MGALLAARLLVDSGDTKTARVQLTWAADNATDSGLRELARLRLAAVMLDEKAYDEAMKQLSVEPSAAFAPRFAEMRGDILSAQGKTDEARKAFDLALEKTDALSKADESRRSGGYREIVQIKRDALGTLK